MFYLGLRSNLIAVVSTSLPTSLLVKEQVTDPKCSGDSLLHSSPLLIWRYQRTVQRNVDSMDTTLSALILVYTKQEQAWGLLVSFFCSWPKATMTTKLVNGGLDKFLKVIESMVKTLIGNKQMWLALEAIFWETNGLPVLTTVRTESWTRWARDSVQKVLMLMFMYVYLYKVLMFLC